MVCAAPVDEGAETRPEGDPELSADELREAKTSVDFVKHVKPILESRCLYCHDGKGMPGKFEMTSGKTALASGPSGSRIVPGNAGAKWPKGKAGRLRVRDESAGRLEGDINTGG